ncbi:GNAT family N-acetyltransferase [Costertonia aggregata]|uniref:N-acetyltransferase family protein n=1 Tax=Costertonia aggregata TaxID=343403 RepID=A0A7H9AN38_9FLAO|nr:GNAT family N-acetyltransferase [Costertonia aggregata]QLG44866.1 N-acetyltransferase family protein [Costertonia aggregata]
MTIRSMTKGDWSKIAEIYKEGILTGFATFETTVPTFADWDSAHMNSCRLVATDENQKVVGWAALSPVSSRCVYGGVAEVSVYVAKNSRGKSIGKLLMQQLISESEKEGLWTLQSGIFPENEGSILLHKKMGFRYIGKRERVGKLHGEWKDNLLFERRSKIIGV